jgi:hypothetical protein
MLAEQLKYQKYQTVELEKSVRNKRPWHKHVENRSQISALWHAPFLENNGNHHFCGHRSRFGFNDCLRSSAWGWRQRRELEIELDPIQISVATTLREPCFHSWPCPYLEVFCPIYAREKATSSRIDNLAREVAPRVARPSVPAVAAQHYRQKTFSSCQRYTSAVTLRALVFVNTEPSAGRRRHPSFKFGRSPNCCCTARIAYNTGPDRGLREQEAHLFCIRLVGRLMVALACQKLGWFSFSIRPSIVFGTRAVESYIFTSRR